MSDVVPPEPDIVLLGHVVKEMIYFPDRTLGPVLGSPVAYGSVMLGRLGEKVGVVTTVGTDMPDDLLQPFREAQVDMQGMRVKEGACTTASELVYYPSGDKEIRYPQKAPPICFDDIPVTYRSAQMFYVATMDHDMSTDAIRRLRHLGSLMAIDLGGYGGAHSRWHPDPEEQRKATALRGLVQWFDVVRASVEDCRHLLGVARVADERGEEDVVRTLLAWGARVAVMTLGERGCLVGDRDRVLRVPAQRGRVIDTTGAGDCFSAAFLIAYMHSGDIEWAAQFGAAAVIYVIERTGGVCTQRMPTRADVYQRLSSQNVSSQAPHEEDTHHG